jgi:hypothetical protein
MTLALFVMSKDSRASITKMTSKMTFFAVLLAFFGLSHGASVAGQSSSGISGNVSHYVRAEMESQHIPGLALLVSRGGKIVQAEGFGLANVELQVPVKPETIFQSGSMGKQFTATAIMMLVEEGKVGLDDPLTKYLPDAPATWKEVTVRELLSHTAGFGDYPEKFDFRKDWNSAGVSSGYKIRIQQSGISDAGNSDSSRYRGILRRLFATTNLCSVEHVDYAHHQRGRHHSESRRRLPAGEGRIEESGMGGAHDQHDRRWQPVLLRFGPSEVGCGAVHRENSKALEFRPDVDPGKA